MKADYPDLIKQSLKNDKASQFALYKALLPKIMGVCKRYLREIQEAEDCAQEVFIKIFKNLDKYSGEAPFEAWTRRIAVNEALGFIRRSKNFSFQEDIEAYHELIPAGNGIISDINHGELLLMLDKLPENKRLVFNMYVIEGYSHKEISEMLEIKEGTSKSQLSRAKVMLVELLTEIDQM